VASEDWYRNERWGQEIEEDFFAKLKRSRSQKTQYVKIQAGYLIENYPEITLRLIKYARENCPADSWEQEFYLYESKAFYRLAEYEKAISCAYLSVEWRIKKPNHQTEIPYWLAELVLLSGSGKDYQKSLEILSKLHYPTPFPVTEFYFHGYTSLLYYRLGNIDAAKPEAILALSWADKDENLLQNKHKKNLGIFTKKQDWPYNEIVLIANK
jgi:hypothetical protein